MIGQDMVNRLYDCQVIDTEGEKIGSVKRIWLDGRTGDPVWASVHTGLFGLKETFVPLQRAELHDDQLQVPVGKAQVKDAPRIEAEGDQMSDEEQQTLYQYYGVTSTGAGDQRGAGGREGMDHRRQDMGQQPGSVQRSSAGGQLGANQRSGTDQRSAGSGRHGTDQQAATTAGQQRGASQQGNASQQRGASEQPGASQQGSASQQPGASQQGDASQQGASKQPTAGQQGGTSQQAVPTRNATRDRDPV